MSTSQNRKSTVTKKKKRVPTEAQLKALEKARETRKANIAARKRGERIIPPKKREIDTSLNKKGKVVSAARQRAGKINIQKRLDRLNKKKVTNDNKMEEMVSKALLELKEIIPFELEEGKDKDKPEPIKINPKSSEIVLDLTEQVQNEAVKIINCLKLFERKKYSTDERENCITALVDSLKMVSEIVKKMERVMSTNFPSVDSRVKMIAIDSILDLNRYNTDFINILLNSY